MKLSALCITLMFLLNGCAMIMNGSTSNLNVRTDPKGASVLITNRAGKEVFRGTSPVSVRLENGAGYFKKAQYVVKLTAPGYTEKTVTIMFRFNGWYVGNVLFGGLIGALIIDPASGAMWKIVDPLVDEELTRNGTAGTPQLRIIDVHSLSEAQRASLIALN